MMDSLYNFVNPNYAAALTLKTQCAASPVSCVEINKAYDLELDMAVTRLRWIGLGLLVVGGIAIFRRGRA